MEIFFMVLRALLFGGLICGAVQILMDLTALTPARILVGCVVTGVLLGAVGLYEPLLRTFGCGISVPLVGFGGAVATGVKEEVAKSGLMGVFTGSLTAAAGGTSAALIFGYIAALVTKSHPKGISKRGVMRKERE